MIKMLIVQNRHAPCFFCDMCSERITNAEEANLLTYHDRSPTYSDSETYDVIHVHRGKCDKKARQWMIDNHKTSMGWGYLSADLVNLLINTGYTEDKWKEWKQLAESLDCI